MSDTNKSVKNVAVIGGGAAGLIAAWAAAKNNSVFLIERNEKLGKKLYITGKGRCNITNTDDKDEFFRSVFRNPKFLYSAINAFSNQDIVRLIEANGVKTKVERGGRIFPESDKSSDVIRALTKNAEKAGVNIALNTRVKAVKKIENGFDIEFYSNPQSIPSKYDAVIICTGGKSYSSTGSTGDGYELARCFGHTIVELKPSLTGLCTNEQWVSDLQGLTLKNVQLTAYRNGKKIYSDMGEMLFTHFGVSGPLVLTLSGHIADDPIGVLLSIDLKPALSENTLDRRILSDFDKHKHKLLKNALVDLLPSRMISVIINQSGISAEKSVDEITAIERAALLKALKSLQLTVSGTPPIHQAIVTRGGVSVKEIDPRTMESKLVKGLYFAGEVIDCDAQTGGYNLQIAFSTGYLAGSSANDLQNDIGEI
ncbi:MAG TPA: NAD(P)/FAD-dependent oxidoreductase [Clostridiales bacterium]|nr:NAD(P)/FAD-dependent oxidoreductase [Clostridiales bacterium]